MNLAKLWMLGTVQVADFACKADDDGDNKIFAIGAMVHSKYCSKVLMARSSGSRYMHRV